MSIQPLAALLFGLAFLGIGMAQLTAALRAAAGGRLSAWLSQAALHPLGGLAAGALGTAALQSSSALTVLLVGFVRGGALSPAAALPVLIGSNLGTTLTPWLLLWGNQAPARAGIPLPCALLGLLGLAACIGSRPALRRTGRGLLAAGLMLAGLALLGRAAQPLRSAPALMPMSRLLAQPLVGYLGAAAFTALVQSSAAVLALAQSFCRGAGPGWGVLLPPVAGVNLGTCSTALLASVGQGGQAGRRVALAHLRFNAVGGLAAFAALGLGQLLCPALLSAPAPAWAPAALHTLFNLMALVLVWPVRNRLLLGKKIPLCG